MKLVDNWISDIRSGYKTKSVDSIDKDVKIVSQLLNKANRSVGSGLPMTIRKEWEDVIPRLISLQRNLQKQRMRLLEGK